ncbi:hypothetical protein ACE6H2_006810 [Prunus campanulata]
MLRLKFPVTPFSLYSQSNPSPKTHYLTLLMFSFGSTSCLAEFTANHSIILWQGSCFRLFVCYYVQVDHWKSYFP